ncbi:MAG: hypothetical protein KA712_24685 [Myxococcales bacterium]|nr:hypothetical protein [Myxococcales bacterium]
MKSENYDEFEQLLLRSSRQDGLPAAKRERIAAAVRHAVDAPSWSRNVSSASRLVINRFGLPLWVKASLLLCAGSASAYVAVRENVPVTTAPVAVHTPSPKPSARSARKHQPSRAIATLGTTETVVVAEPLAEPVMKAIAAEEPMTEVSTQPELTPPPAAYRIPRTVGFGKAQAPKQSLTTSTAPVEESTAPIEPSKIVEQTGGPRPESLLAAEVDILRKVRASLLAKNAPMAMAALKEYEATRPNGGILAEELEVLRIDALLLAGDQVNASRAIDAFLMSRPKSAKTSRLRALIAAPTTKDDPDKHGRPVIR